MPKQCPTELNKAVDRARDELFVRLERSENLRCIDRERYRSDIWFLQQCRDCCKVEVESALKSRRTFLDFQYLRFNSRNGKSNLCLKLSL